jgi:hypothetical protein
VTRLMEMPRPDNVDMPNGPSSTIPFVNKFKELLASRKEAK